MPKAAGTVIEDVVSQLIGDDVLPLVKALKNKQNVSEFKLASTIRREINLTRNMLYRLYDQNLVSFNRKKDKKKGWYIYYWTFNVKRIKYLAEELKKKRLEKLQERLGREQTTQFFSCKSNCIRLSFEQATDFEYKCPECGELLNQEDNSKKIYDIKTEIVSLQKALAAKPAKLVIKEAVKMQPKKKHSTPKAKGKRAKARR